MAPVLQACAFCGLPQAPDRVSRRMGSALDEWFCRDEKACAGRYRRKLARLGDRMTRIANGYPADLFPMNDGAMPDGKPTGIAPPSARTCCPKAQLRACVCLISITCPDHGDQCWGSHD